MVLLIIGLAAGIGLCWLAKAAREELCDFDRGFYLEIRREGPVEVREWKRWKPKLLPVPDVRVSAAETYLRLQPALYRYYPLVEVQAHVKAYAGVDLSMGETVLLVQKLRDEMGLGPINRINL
jgi:hypothetical protein